MITRDLFPLFGRTYLSLIGPHLGDDELLAGLTELLKVGQEASFEEVARLFRLTWRERLIALCLAMAKQPQQYVDVMLHSLRAPLGHSIVPTCAALAVLSHAGLYEMSTGQFDGFDRTVFNGELGWAIDKAFYSAGLSNQDRGARGPNHGQIFEDHVALYHWLLTASRHLTTSDVIR